jgi:hypothetical protein
MTGVDPNGFVQFDTPENGQRALSINLANQANLHGINTVRGLIGKYAPPSDNNDTDAYIARVSQSLGVGPDDQINPNDPRINQALQAVIVPTEQGGVAPAPSPAATPQQPAAPDPFLAALDGATKGGGSPPSQSSGNSPISGGAGVSPGGVRPVDLQSAGGSSTPSRSLEDIAGTATGDTLNAFGKVATLFSPSLDALAHNRSVYDTTLDHSAGFLTGVAQIPAAALNLGGYLSEKLGANDTGHAFRTAGDFIGRGFTPLSSDPTSEGFQGNKALGEFAATVPVAEIKPLTALAEAGDAGKIARLVARYGDMAGQGAAAGAVSSHGKDMGQNMAYGAAFAPMVGAAGDILIPPALKVAGAVSSKAKSIAGAIREAAGVEAPDAAQAAVTAQTIRKASQLPAGATDVQIDGAGNVLGFRDAQGHWTVNIDGGTPEAPKPAPPKSATSDEMRAALGSRGSNSGLEANPNLAPDVAAHVDRLTQQGVPLDQAVREAEITAVGAKPTIANVTRNPEDQSAVWEGAKQATPEGRALSSQIAQNNAAVVNRVQGMVQDLGGVPAQGEAAETAATSLAKASDAEKAKVSELYKAADEEAAQSTSATDARDNVSLSAHKKIADQLRANYEAAQAAIEEANAAKRARLIQGGGAPPIREIPPPEKPTIPDAPPLKRGSGYIDVTGFRRALDNPEMANPTIEGVKSLRSGVSGLLDAYAGDTNKITLEQAEKLRQAINDAYDPMGSGINGHVSRLKASLDAALDSTEAGPAYKAARAAHKAWAAKYDNPEGIASLIKRDAQGNFVNGDNWRKAEGFIGSTADKPFVQVVNQLKANGDTAAINRLKASILQRAYERATNNATDRLGNAMLNGKQFFAELNRVGTTKLNALFSPAELSDIATTGRAAIHLNEAVPGTNNTSNTASALAKALQSQGKKSGKVKTALKLGAHGVSLVTGHLGGNIATEGGSKIVEAVTEHGKAQQLAKALTESMTPAKARAAERVRAAKMATLIARRSKANQISRRLAVTGAAVAGGKR